jgi:hypothetical protein
MNLVNIIVLLEIFFGLLIVMALIKSRAWIFGYTVYKENQKFQYILVLLLYLMLFVISDLMRERGVLPFYIDLSNGSLAVVR